MVVKRIAALALVLLTGACARFPGVPTAYSALSSVSAPASAPVSAPAAAAGPQAGATRLPAGTDPGAPSAPATLALGAPAVIIPGTPTAAFPERGLPGVNPAAVLDTATRARLTWKPLRSADLLRPPALVARPAARVAGGDRAETRDAGAGAPIPDAAMPVPAHPYDRDAAMDRLLQRSVRTAATICSGC